MQQDKVKVDDQVRSDLEERLNQLREELRQLRDGAGTQTTATTEYFENFVRVA